jgi:sodium transport system permease protein
VGFLLATPRSSARPFQAALFFTVLLWTLAAVSLSLNAVKQPLVKLLVPQAIFVAMIVCFHLVFDQQRGDLRERMHLRPLQLQQVLKVLLVSGVAWVFTLCVSNLFIMLVELGGGKMPSLYDELLALPFPLAIAVGALAPAICEELAFRGYIFGHLRPLGLNVAIILSGFLFGVMHFSVIRLVPLALLGMIMASAVQRTRSLGASMLIHFLNNGVVITLSHFTSDSASTSGPPGLTTILTVVVMTVALGAAVLAALRWLGPLRHPAGAEEFEESMAVAAAEAVAAGQARRLRRLSATLVALTILPGILLYLVFAVGELYIVFR